MSAHDISPAAFADLARGEGGAGAVAELNAAQAAKHRILVRLVVVESAGHEHAAVAGRAYEALSEMEARARDEVDRCLRYPAVGAWALRTCRALPRGGEPGRMAAVALAAAVRTRTPCRLAVPVAGELTLPSVGRLALSSGTPELAEVVVEPTGEGVELRVGGRPYRIDVVRDGPGWQVLHRVPGPRDTSLTIDDLDPYRWPGEDADGRLSDDRRALWTACLDEARLILETRHPETADELAAVVSVLTPVLARSRTQHSASARESFGTIALSDPLDGLGMAATLTHELQHAKLNALTEVVPLTVPDDGRRYYAPWRPDPRPLFGLLHGVYAHAGVVAFWRRHVEDDHVAFRAQVEFARWREAAYESTGTLLRSGGLTRAGTDFVTVLRDTLSGRLTEPVASDAAARARRESEHHRQEWARANDA